VLINIDRDSSIQSIGRILIATLQHGVDSETFMM